MAESYEVKISFVVNKITDGSSVEINSINNVYSGMDYANVVVVQQVAREMVNNLFDLGVEKAKMMGMGDKLKILDGLNAKKAGAVVAKK